MVTIETVSYFLSFLFKCLSGGFKLFIPFCENLYVTALQFVLGGNITNRTVQTFIVVVLDLLDNLMSGFFR